MIDSAGPKSETSVETPELSDDAIATPDAPVAIELPLEDGDADAQPI